jgi:hypothetical protein
MSEFTNARENRTSFRWQLLATVSAIALIGSAYGLSEAKAADNDSDHPPLWIELGGQLSRLNDGEEAFAPPLMTDRPSILAPSQKFERLPLYSLEETGKISFQPDGSDWVLSASVRYGRSSSDKHVRQQTSPNPFIQGSLYLAASGAKFADTNAQTGEHHFVLDFQAGKDVGLGMFGSKGASVFNLGVRFAQFGAGSNIALKSDPDWHFQYKYFGTVKAFALPGGGIFHSNVARLQAERSFHGIGPSLSWNASTPFAGNTDRGEIALDWGVNAAILFGRQKANVHHQATAHYRHLYPTNYHHAYTQVTYQPPPANITRLHSVTVPNVGGFASASWRIQNFKVSAGYRADLFFGAMDGGIDAAKKENVGFYGPFANVSIGIGG